MGIFIPAFIAAMFCAWCLTDAGFTRTAWAISGIIGLLSGVFGAHMAGELKKREERERERRSDQRDV